MTTYRSGLLVMVLAAAALIGGCATPESGPPAAVGTGAPSPAAVPADLLQACLARIPADATPGQRAIAEQRCAREDAEWKAVMGAATPAAQSSAASGTQGDTLQACLARIPKEASAGQRMIAERSCERDEEARKEVERVPGR